MINHFNSNIAIQYGLNASTFIQALSQWTFNNLANKRNLHDGYCWSYNTLEAFGTIFPWWGKRQLETIISGLVKQGLVVKGNYNKHRYDRTCWYALTYKAMEFYPELITQDNLKALLGTISPKWEMETPDFGNNKILENHFTKMRNGVHENVTPIPTSNSTKDISKDISVNAPENVNEKKTKTKNKSFGIVEMKADNPHNIDEDVLSDWLEVRKEKRQKMTATAWKETNDTLAKIEKQLKISPLEAFKKMVTKSWASVELEYFQNNSNGNAGNSSQGTGVKDYYGNDITWE